jgi:lipopolysaccharide export system ATP-binding protein
MTVGGENTDREESPSPAVAREPASSPEGAVNGHPSYMVNGAAIDPTVVEGLCAYHLGKRYKKKPVLRDVSIGVQRGEAVGLLGPNGAGKTTCFYIITGLIKADAGAIYLDGQEVTDQPMFERARSGIGYLPQEASIFRGMSVEDNIMAVLEVVDSDAASRVKRLDQLLGDFSIAHLRKVPAMALSGGERRRVEIARALATRPSYILLDEPLAGIDPIAVNDIRDIISHLKDRGIGVLITDHNVRDTLEIVDRAYILHEGEVLREGSPADIVSDEDVRRVYLGERFSL